MLSSSILALLPVGASAAALWNPLVPRAASKVEIPSVEDWEARAKEENRELCVIYPDTLGRDDGPKIMDALNDKCHSNSLVVLPGTTYHINTNMTTLGLQDVQIHLYGTMLWSPDIEYWLSVSMPVGFQNQSTVWYFGGDNVVWDGYGVGTLDGNGQVWYDWAKGGSNLADRPMMINWREMSNSVVRNQRFVQSQMWTMATTWSKNLLFEDIYVNNTSSSQYSTLNTDGIDTIYSDNITLSRWDVTCGDDGIALKRNSSNIFVYDSVLRGGQGLAVGSIAQYLGEYDFIDGLHVRNLTLYDTNYAMYIKTWPGHQDGYPPNGGGGGIGNANNILMEDVTMHEGRGAPVFLWQCENYNGNLGKDCDSSEFSFTNLEFRRVSATMKPDVVAAGQLKCSAASGGCHNVTVSDYHVTHVGSDEELDFWYCSNVHEATGFTCEDFPPPEEEEEE